MQRLSHTTQKSYTVCLCLDSMVFWSFLPYRKKWIYIASWKRLEIHILEPEGNTVIVIRYVTNVLSAHGRKELIHPLEVIRDHMSSLANEIWIEQPCETLNNSLWTICLPPFKATDHILYVRGFISPGYQMKRYKIKLPSWILTGARYKLLLSHATRIFRFLYSKE